MRFVKGVAPFIVTLAVVAVTTAVLLYFKLAGAGPHHPIFLYLLPIALVAFLFGSMPATLFAIVAIFCSAFFLYDPIYSFRVANPTGVRRPDLLYDSGADDGEMHGRAAAPDQSPGAGKSTFRTSLKIRTARRAGRAP